MRDFETMSDEEFASYLCPTVQLFDQTVRGSGIERQPDYRKQLVEADRICMEPVW